MRTLGLLVLCVLCSRGTMSSGTYDSQQGHGRSAMSIDTEAREPRGPRIPRRFLPDIIGLTIERVPFEPPQHRFVESVYADYREALAFTIEIEGEFRLEQAVTPVLYVGDVEISHVERFGRGRYRFLAFEDEERQMRSGAPIALGWPGQPREKRETPYRFQLPPQSEQRK
jgi:hypothetical protein